MLTYFLLYYYYTRIFHVSSLFPLFSVHLPSFLFLPSLRISSAVALNLSFCMKVSPKLSLISNAHKTSICSEFTQIKRKQQTIETKNYRIFEIGSVRSFFMLNRENFLRKSSDYNYHNNLFRPQTQRIIISYIFVDFVEKRREK